MKERLLALLFGYLPQIAKALAPPIMVGLAWLAGHVPGVDSPPVGLSEWLASLVVGIVVWAVPNKPKPAIGE